MGIIEAFGKLLAESGFAALTWREVVMLIVSCVLLYLAIKKKFEPLLLRQRRRRPSRQRLLQPRQHRLLQPRQHRLLRPQQAVARLSAPCPAVSWMCA